jgi:ATP-dependent Lon protease
VATKGRHRFIDKVHVRYVEKEKAALGGAGELQLAAHRHRRERFYRDNDRLLEGGIWAEVTVAYNDIEEDDYAFYIEDLRPIQLSRFNFEGYQEGGRPVHARRVAGHRAALRGLEPPSSATG